MKLTRLETITRALGKAGVPFIVVGGFAVVAHGYGRQTQDFDMVLRLQPRAVKTTSEALGARVTGLRISRISPS